VQCLLFVSGASYCDTLSFRIGVGEIRICDPIPDNSEPPLYWAYDDVDTFYLNHPEYEWIECYGIGTQLVLGDDQTVTIDLPSGFVFKYYGQDYTQISVCSNGWIVAGFTTVQSYYNYGLPSTQSPANIIAVNWDDLDPRTGPGIWYYYEPMKHCLVVEWDSVPYYGSNTPEKFEVIIYDTTVHTPSGNNVIVAQYATANRYTSSTIGIQDLSCTIGIQCLYDTIRHRGTAPIAPGRSIKFITADPSVGIELNPEIETKSEFSIIAYPNPFVNKVKFVLNKTPSPNSKAKIYDNTGREVRTLLVNPSSTVLIWDGKDNEGLEVKSGVYFLRLGDSKNQSITKVLLIR